MARLLYGVRGQYADVTHVLDCGILLPAEDVDRSAVFGGDPLPGVLKEVVLVDCTGRETVFPAGTEATLSRTIARGIIVTVTRGAELKTIATIHRRLNLVHGSLQDEFPEQVMAAKFVPPEACVLEIGGNVGRNSCVIGSILEHSSRLLVLESDPENARMLAENRDANGLGFAIECSALSRRPLVQSEWITKPYDGGEVPEGWFRVPTITWDDLRAKHDMPFDTLVLDCEGALYYILMDEPDLLTNFRRILIENDFEDIDHKRFVDDNFCRHGFSRIFWQPGGWGPCYSCFFEVWAR